MTVGRVLLGVVAVLAVGGCGIVAPDAVARPVASGGPPAAGSSAPPVDRAALQARVTAAEALRTL